MFKTYYVYDTHRLGRFGGDDPMPFRSLFSATDRVLERALDGLSMRQRVSAHNIANVNTPGYKRYTLSFETALREAIQSAATTREIEGVRTHPKHFPIGQRRDNLAAPLEPRRVTDTFIRNDGNNVDIEAEMAQMIKDQVHYAAVAQEAARRYGMLRDAITGGR